MPAWAGSLHGIVELKCLSDLREVPDDAHSTTVGLSGRRRVRMAPQVSRSWSAGINVSDPSEVATLQELYWAHRGQALWLVTEAAQVQNVLPPPLRVLERDRGVMVPRGWTAPPETTLTAGGSVLTVDGMAAASVLIDGTGHARSPFMPVVPGLSVTGSAYVPAGGRVRLAWVAADGTETVGATSDPAAAGDGLSRASVTAMPDASRTACRLRVMDCDVYARPQVTWTAAPVPYVTGRGAESVVLGPLNEDVMMALSDGSRNLSGYSYTITEVG